MKTKIWYRQKNLNDFFKKCTEDFKLNIIGLMCIPPQNKDVQFYFKNY